MKNKSKPRSSLQRKRRPGGSQVSLSRIIDFVQEKHSFLKNDSSPKCDPNYQDKRVLQGLLDKTMVNNNLLLSQLTQLRKDHSSTRIQTQKNLWETSAMLKQMQKLKDQNMQYLNRLNKAREQQAKEVDDLNKKAKEQRVRWNNQMSLKGKQLATCQSKLKKAIAELQIVLEDRQTNQQKLQILEQMHKQLQRTASDLILQNQSLKNQIQFIKELAESDSQFLKLQLKQLQFQYETLQSKLKQKQNQNQCYSIPFLGQTIDRNIVSFQAMISQKKMPLKDREQFQLMELRYFDLEKSLERALSKIQELEQLNKQILQENLTHRKANNDLLARVAELQHDFQLKINLLSQEHKLSENKMAEQCRGLKLRLEHAIPRLKLGQEQDKFQVEDSHFKNVCNIDWQITTQQSNID